MALSQTLTEADKSKFPKYVPYEVEEAGGVGWKCYVGTAVAAILGIDSPNYTLQ